MTQNMDRRRWVQRIAQSLAAWSAAGSLRAVDYDKPAPGSEKLTAEQSNGLLVFRWNNRTIGAYRAHSSQKFPYFYPLCGPATGVSLLAESALPYPYHRGLWLGCQPMNEGDYWGDTPLDKGQIRSTQLQLGKAAPESAVFTNECEWIRKDAPSPLEAPSSLLSSLKSSTTDASPFSFPPSPPRWLARSIFSPRHECIR